MSRYSSLLLGRNTSKERIKGNLKKLNLSNLLELIINIEFPESIEVSIIWTQKINIEDVLDWKVLLKKKWEQYCKTRISSLL